ncbi:MAG: hypothetical protein ACRYG2_24265 [Janthinobacterium lividum]
MLPRPARPQAPGATATLSAHLVPASRVLHRQQVVEPEAPRVVLHPDLLPDVAGAPVDTFPGYGACTPAQSQIVCADNASCICPLSDHVTDAERAVVNDISRQASRLATALAWIFALVALTALVLLMLR